MALSFIRGDHDIPGLHSAVMFPFLSFCVQVTLLSMRVPFSFGLTVLLLFPDSLKGCSVRFLVHELASLGVPLDPSLVLRVEGLRTSAYRADSAAITNRRILRHLFCLLPIVIAEPLSKFATGPDFFLDYPGCES